MRLATLSVEPLADSKYSPRTVLLEVLHRKIPFGSGRWQRDFGGDCVKYSLRRL